MSRIRHNAVQILNPLPGGAHYTTLKSARQFVRRGLAVFESADAICFLNQERRASLQSDLEGTDGVFCWRRGETGGMVQMLGSLVGN
jgi:hypothetical protein